MAGLCPLHRDSHPSFYVNRRKQVFYCHGCGHGGGLARLIRLLDHLPESTMAVPAAAQAPEHVYHFYRQQLEPSGQGREYLRMRGIHDPAIVERMGIGYAPGACLRSHLERLGHRRPALLQRGLIDERGRDTSSAVLLFL